MKRLQGHGCNSDCTIMLYTGYRLALPASSHMVDSLSCLLYNAHAWAFHFKSLCACALNSLNSVTRSSPLTPMVTVRRRRGGLGNGVLETFPHFLGFITFQRHLILVCPVLQVIYAFLHIAVGAKRRYVLPYCYY